MLKIQRLSTCRRCECPRALHCIPHAIALGPVFYCSMHCSAHVIALVRVVSPPPEILCPSAVTYFFRRQATKITAQTPKKLHPAPGTVSTIVWRPVNYAPLSLLPRPSLVRIFFVRACTSRALVMGTTTSYDIYCTCKCYSSEELDRGTVRKSLGGLFTDQGTVTKLFQRKKCRTPAFLRNRHTDTTRPITTNPVKIQSF